MFSSKLIAHLNLLELSSGAGDPSRHSDEIEGQGQSHFLEHSCSTGVKRLARLDGQEDELASDALWHPPSNRRCVNMATLSPRITLGFQES